MMRRKRKRPRPIEVDISVESSLWDDVDLSIIETTLQSSWNDLVNSDLPEACDVSVVLTDNQHIRQLNQQYRQKDKPTNVLSFPTGEPIPGIDEWSLGDIILAYETINQEAEQQQKGFQHHLQHLLVHGLLHLLGYDHIEDSDAHEMEQQEISTLAKLGIENPYEVN
ncbi:MAG: rRNA maturation RNase YbeY [Alphaproteobacteria bacterium]